jgi:hypothetical protein
VQCFVILCPYGEELITTTDPPKLEDHPLCAVFEYLFSILVDTLHVWRPSPLSATGGFVHRFQVKIIDKNKTL